LSVNIKNALINSGFSKSDHAKSIYINLYESIKKGIINRVFDNGFKLPATRLLAKDLNISRSTVIKAYDLLTLEKYVTSNKGSGHYVTATQNKKIRYKLTNPKSKGRYPKISKRGKAFKKNIHIINSESIKGIAFRPGLPPLDVFPVQQWKNLSNQYWKTIKSSELTYSATTGLESLKKNISNYLNIYRNIICDPRQIIITTGSLHSLYLIGSALIDTNDEVILENPIYPNAYNLFDSLGAKICSANIDEEGINIDSVTAKNPKLIYTTPSNQYPRGVKMSLNRRLKLLKWATEKNTLIIEDDYDHEFSNWENPIASVLSLDNQDRVIYLGTFNKLLHPSIRIGYMIIPSYLVDTISSIYQQSSRFVPHAQQKILSAFIEKDYLNKHLRNVIQVSIERKKIFHDSFTSNFENQISLDSNNTGLHIIGALKDGIEDKKLAQYLTNKNIIAHPLSNYFINGQKENGLVMGYSSVNNKRIRETIARMKKEYSIFLT